MKNRKRNQPAPTSKVTEKYQEIQQPQDETSADKTKTQNIVIDSSRKEAEAVMRDKVYPLSLAVMILVGLVFWFWIRTKMLLSEAKANKKEVFELKKIIQEFSETQYMQPSPTSGNFNDLEIKENLDSQ